EIERASTRPVLRDDSGIAGQIFAEVARDEPAIGVVTITGGRIADHRLDLLAGNRNRPAFHLCRTREQHQQARQKFSEADACAKRVRVPTGRSDVGAPHSAARSSRVASRWATTSSTCITSAYL